jgi:hypothetical protein
VDESTTFLSIPPNFDPKLLWKNFFEPGSKMELNLPGSLQAPAAALAAANRFDTATWAPVLEKARDNIAQMLDQDVLTRFWKSPEFRAIHEPAVRSQIKGLDKATKLLGIKKKPLLEELLFQIRLNGADSAEAKAASDKLLKEEKLSMARDALLKALKSGGFL